MNNDDYNNETRPGHYWDHRTRHWYKSPSNMGKLRNFGQGVYNGVLKDWLSVFKRPSKMDRIFFTFLYFLASIPWYLIKWCAKWMFILSCKLIKFAIATLKRQSSEIHYHNPNIHKL